MNRAALGRDCAADVGGNVIQQTSHLSLHHLTEVVVPSPVASRVFDVYSYFHVPYGSGLATSLGQVGCRSALGSLRCGFRLEGLACCRCGRCARALCVPHLSQI